MTVGRRGHRRARAKRAGRRGHHRRAAAAAGRDAISVHDERAGPAHRSGAVRRHDRERRAGRAHHATARRRPRGAGRRRLQHGDDLQRPAGGGAWRSFNCPARTRSRPPTPSTRRWRSSRSASRRAWTTRFPTTPRASCARASSDVVQHAARGRRPGRAGRARLPAKLAHLASCRSSPFPVSLIGTFAAMWVAGFSMNILSLFGLVLAIGIVVDDAIVVVENVERWIEHGLSPREAAFKAMDEVTPAIIAIAFGLSAVFIPVAFVSGITGQFYRQFALTISFSTLLSAFNSLTLSPALAALLLQAAGREAGLAHARDESLLRLVLPALQSRLRRLEPRLHPRRCARSCVISGIALLVYVGLVVARLSRTEGGADRFHPAAGSGLPHRQRADAGRRLDRRARRAMLTRLSEVGAQDARRARRLHRGRAEHPLALELLRRGRDVHAAPARSSKRDGQSGDDAPTPSPRSLRRAVQRDSRRRRSLVFPPPPVRGVGSAGGFKMQIEDRSGPAARRSSCRR